MSTEIKEILRPYRCFINQESETVAAIKSLIESKLKAQREKLKLTKEERDALKYWHKYSGGKLSKKDAERVIKTLQK